MKQSNSELAFASQQTMPNCTLNDRSMITIFSTDNDKLTTHNNAHKRKDNLEQAVTRSLKRQQSVLNQLFTE